MATKAAGSWLLRRAVYGWQSIGGTLNTPVDAVGGIGSRWLSTVLGPQWIFLGPPGVGKGTYSKRVAEHAGVPHISTGDLVRSEIDKDTILGRQMQQIIKDGNLLPDDTIGKLLDARLLTARHGFILDGYPRTRNQAEVLSRRTNIQLVINLDLREEVLVQKCIGRRICAKCKRDFNLADIYLEASNGRPSIVMPPLSPPDKCLEHMKMREDDKDEVIRKRIQVYKAETKPVEDFYKALGILLDFEITGGIPETLPKLLQALHGHFPPIQAETRQMFA